jgi:hypothetical protein
MSVLLVFFVIRMDRNRRQSEAALATLRQEAAEEQHIVRLGLLASGAAHELGTPMATMSVILGDWQRHPAIAADPDLRDEVQDMASELRRCKTILSGILMSAGEARGDNPQITTLGEFLGTIADEWNERCHGAVHFINKVGSERPIVADPALRQIIGNVIDNALEVSPHLVEFRAEMDAYFEEYAKGKVLLEIFWPPTTEFPFVRERIVGRYDVIGQLASRLIGTEVSLQDVGGKGRDRAETIKPEHIKISTSRVVQFLMKFPNGHHYNHSFLEEIGQLHAWDGVENTAIVELHRELLEELGHV